LLYNLPFFFKEADGFGNVSDSSVIPKTFLILFPIDCLRLIGSFGVGLVTSDGRCFTLELDEEGVN
jgi:hypothetical protein